jgi:hypothetical protein
VSTSLEERGTQPFSSKNRSPHLVATLRIQEPQRKRKECVKKDGSLGVVKIGHACRVVKVAAAAAGVEIYRRKHLSREAAVQLHLIPGVITWCARVVFFFASVPAELLSPLPPQTRGPPFLSPFSRPLRAVISLWSRESAH